jgi:tetratricopeptide (TPR) repeat protein
MLYRPLALASIVFAAVAVLAQDGSLVYPRSDAYSVQSGLSGTVHDLSGKPVSGARVEIVDLNTGRTITSAYTYSNGSFEFPMLEGGRYEVIATAGVNESRARVEGMGIRDVNLRIANQTQDKGNGNTVSVAQMRVPGKARKIFDKAMDAFHKARIDDAFSLVQKALGMYPDYAQALTLRGVLKMRKGDNVDAQPDLEKALELDNTDDMSFVALASLYNNEKRYDEAARLLQRGIVLHPESWQAHMEMARAEVGKKQPDAALRSLASCERNAPADVYYPHLIRAQALVQLKSYPAAITELESFLRKEPAGPNSEPARKLLAGLRTQTAAQNDTALPVASK